MIHRRRQDGHKNSAADALSSDIREKLISREEPQLAVPPCFSHSLCHVFLHRPDGSNFMSAGAVCAMKP